MRSLLWLLAGGLVAWLLTAIPAAHLANDPAQSQATYVYSATALLICLVPTGLTLVLSVWGSRQQPHDQWLIVVGGTGVRMFATLGVGVALYMGVDYYRQYPGFWLWILGAYLVTLALETVLVLRTLPTGPSLPGQTRA